MALKRIVTFDTLAELRASNIFSTTTQNELVSEILGYYSINDGGYGSYYFDTANTSTDNGGSIIKPNSIPLASPGRWVGIFENDFYNIKRWGAIPDYGSGNTDNSVFLQGLIDHFPQGSAATIFIPSGKYYCSQTINIIDKPLKIVGESSLPYSVGESKLIFPQSKTGLKWTIVTGQIRGSLNNLVIEAESKNPSDPTFLYCGIELSTVLSMKNVRVLAFSGHGLTLSAAINLGTNVSLSRLEGVVSSNNNGSGFYISGPDANQISFIGCDARDNLRYGFEDLSFLGNQYFGCHGNNNSLGHYYSSNVNARSSYFGCYGESGSPPSQAIGSFSNFIGGIHENGIIKATQQMGSFVYNEGLNFVRRDYIIGNGGQLGIGLHEGQIDFYGPNAAPMSLKSIGPYQETHFSMDFNNTSFGESQVWEILGCDALLKIPMEAQLPQTPNIPRRLVHASHAFRHLYLTGKHIGFTFDELSTQLTPHYQGVSYHQSDIFFNARYNGTNSIGWICFENGTIGTYSEGLTVTNPTGGFIVTLSAPTSVLKEGQTILINGVKAMILGFDSGNKSKPQLDVDLGTITTPQTISYNLPKFKPFSDTNDTIDLTFFGDGSDGDATITGPNQTVGSWLTSGALSRDAYLNNLTIQASGSINLNGFKLFVKNTLNISNASSNAIQRNGTSGLSATSSVGASAPAAQSSQTLGNGTTGGAGGAGGATTGSQAAAISGPTPSNGGRSGAGGAGGSGSSGAGGAQRTSSAPAGQLIIKRPISEMIRGVSLLLGGGGAPGGSGGGGDGTAGGGGGSGGNGGNIGFIAAKTINRSSSTASGAISLLGGNGGNGFSQSAGNRGGGGGGGAGGGGWLYLMYKFLSGTTSSNMIRCGGGNGGNGGNGFGSGQGGRGGNGGYGGRITVINLLSNAVSEVDLTSVAGANGGSNSGVSGGSGGAGTSCSMNL
jgi:hypothetical protein